MSSLNADSTASNTALDAWLKANFLDPYNVDVIYHTNSYFHEYDRNVTPPDPSVVQPSMQTVLSGYYAPYNKVAGESFLKKYGFKQLVLWGSTSYDGSLVGYAGTASGGIRVNIFGLDGFSTGPSFVPGMLHLIHHEYTHILQQTYTMPSDFQQFTAAYYNANWTQTPADTSHKYGFVSSYASENPVEDMAETNAYMLVSGPSWFDYWVKTSSAGATGLREKESSIVNYYNNMGIDYRALQKEVQLYIKDTVKDPSVTFPYWLNRGTPYTSLTVNLTDNMYNLYGQSTSFAEEYKALQDAIKVQTGWLATGIQLLFTSKNTMTLRIPFTYGDGTGNFLGDFDFSMSINETTGTVQFAKVTNKTGTTYSNGSYFASSVTNTIQAYLTSNVFIGDWLQYKPQYNVPANMFTKTGGFYVQSDPDNYFYGPLSE
ncbi:substrate import-associated zinc metallohydrolase lipoprotein [Arachidicoccus ginsenosidimutans]|uniref:substrate import-associated zinc metallohydrolase lipoprotein n=1 Tax=Arachidicoccus sp. BS20 TaxID=1850526 RepID=UPI0018D37E5E|nr:substrate import-associated zinc metallohydrolase lipoprotein [Arachidicoccus sp. BS20]